MKLPQLRPRRKIGDLAPKDKIFAEASALAQLRLEQCITDLHERIGAPNDPLDPPRASAADEIGRVA